MLVLQHCYEIIMEVMPINMGGGRDTSPEYFFEQAGRMLRARRYGEALKGYKKAVSEGHPEPARCWNGAAMSSAVMGKDQKALEYYAKALKITPMDGRIFHNRAQSLRRLGHHEAAEADLRSANRTRNEAAKLVQRIARGAIGRQRAGDKLAEVVLETQSTAALRIQTAQRGRIGRQRSGAAASEQQTLALAAEAREAALRLAELEEVGAADTAVPAPELEPPADLSLLEEEFGVAGSELGAAAELIQVENTPVSARVE